MSAPHPVLTTPSGLSARAERLDGLDVLAIRDGDGRLVLRVDAETGQVTLESRGGLSICAPQGTLRLEAARLEVDAEQIELRARQMRQRVGLLETRARRIVERATDVYREAEELAQIKARDIRQVATDTLRMLGQRVRVKAAEDVKLKGEQIHLG